MDKLYKVYAGGNLRAECYSERQANEIERDYWNDGYKTKIVEL